jgi:DNA replication protein DnaC
MSDSKQFHQQLLKDLAELRLTHIAETYREVLDEAARKNASALQVLATLLAAEVATRRARALERRILQARLPKRKTLDDYDFNFPKRISKQKVLRLFDCEFVTQRRSAVLLGPTGIGKTHLLIALGYAACAKGFSVHYTRVIDMLNRLTHAHLNGTLEKAIKSYVHPSLLLLDELGYLPIDKRGADLLFQVVAARYESGSIVLTTNRPFRDWGKICDADNTLATAMLDRLMDHGEVIVIQGASYRRGNDGDEA